jgi:hypothetical protein
MSAVERLAAALEGNDGRVEDVMALWTQGKRTAAWAAENFLAADPGLAAAIELGLAYQEIRALLAERNALAPLRAERLPFRHAEEWHAVWGLFDGHGATEAEALRALTEKLR